MCYKEYVTDEATLSGRGCVILPFYKKRFHLGNENIPSLDIEANEKSINGSQVFMSLSPFTLTLADFRFCLIQANIPFASKIRVVNQLFRDAFMRTAYNRRKLNFDRRSRKFDSTNRRTENSAFYGMVNICTICMSVKILTYKIKSNFSNVTDEQITKLTHCLMDCISMKMETTTESTILPHLKTVKTGILKHQVGVH